MLEMDEITQGKEMKDEKIRLRREPCGTSTFKRLGEEEAPAKDTEKEQPERESSWEPWPCYYHNPHILDIAFDSGHVANHIQRLRKSMLMIC